MVMDALKIVVVDDDAALADALGDTLALKGYQVEAFSDPEQALKRIESEAVDCVITDMVMPGVNGLAIVKTVRECRPEAAIVAITGVPDVAMAIEALRAGADDYVFKPVTDNELERVVARVIERAGLLRTVRQRNAELELLLEASRSLGRATDESELGQLRRALSGRADAASASAETKETLKNIADEVRGRLLSQRQREEEREALSDAMTAARIATTGYLLQGLCHELNNPMAIVLGNAEVLQESPVAETAELAERILRAAHRCTELLRRLVQVANPGGGGESSEVDLGRELSAAIDLLGTELAHRKIHVEVELETTPPVTGSPAAVRDALLAICLNALEAMPEGGRLKVRAGIGEDGSVEIEVIDTGVGMSQEEMARIFDPFYTTKPVGSGTGLGLGLTLVLNTCRRMGGRVAVTSSRDSGSTFRLTFPAAPAS